jgi:hypothetical protein
VGESAARASPTPRATSLSCHALDPECTPFLAPDSGSTSLGIMRAPAVTLTARELAAMQSLACPPAPPPPPPPVARAVRAASYYAEDVSRLEALAASGAADDERVELALRRRA